MKKKYPLILKDVVTVLTLIFNIVLYFLNLPWCSIDFLKHTSNNPKMQAVLINKKKSTCLIILLSTLIVGENESVDIHVHKSVI